jgi:hypothetical protein
MVNKRNPFLLFVLAWVFIFVAPALHAGVVTLKIRAINPSRAEKQKVPVTAVLPRDVKPEHIVSAGELDVIYDVAARAYRVNKEVELNPGETRTFEVVIKDIWEIPEADLTQLAGHAEKLATALKGSGKATTAEELKTLIDEGVKGIATRQAAYAVGVVKPMDHIRVYESNLEVLERVRKDVGMLENLVVAAGKDPESFLGLPKILPPADLGNSAATGGVMVIHLKITNPSLSEKKKVPLRHEFPAEIKSTDVLDAGGLQVGFDATRRLCYAYLEDIELGPQESKVFDVKIRDPWIGLKDQLPGLERRTRDLIAIVKDMESYKAVLTQAQVILSDLEAVKAKSWPAQVNRDYVAFARQQGTAIQGLATRVQRLEELFQPGEKPIKGGVPIMDVPRPDKRTTWVIIYIILGFLGAFSALFFIRWYGKGKAEKTE